MIRSTRCANANIGIWGNMRKQGNVKLPEHNSFPEIQENYAMPGIEFNLMIVRKLPL